MNRGTRLYAFSKPTNIKWVVKFLPNLFSISYVNVNIIKAGPTRLKPICSSVSSMMASILFFNTRPYNLLTELVRLILWYYLPVDLRNQMYFMETGVAPHIAPMWKNISTISTETNWHKARCFHQVATSFTRFNLL